MALVVVTGGSRSGKSSAAQRLAQQRSEEGFDVVVAVFARTEDDRELAARATRHQADRPAGFTTLEATGAADWLDCVPEDGLLVVDCLGTLLGRIMEEVALEMGAGRLQDVDQDTLPEGFAERVEAVLDSIVDAVCMRKTDTIVVTNETGLGMVSVFASARVFCDALGRANQRLAVRADATFIAISGRLLELTALPTDISWPED